MTPLTAGDVVAALRRRYGVDRTTGMAPEWAILTELTGVGFSRGTRADVFAVRAWSGRPKGHERHLIEVKVSRSDLTRELANPAKMAQLGQYAHRLFFATPPGLVRETDNLGEGVGLLEVHPSGVREVRRAKRREPLGLPETIQVEIFRRAGRAEGRIATADGDDLAAKIVAAERRAEAATRAMHTAQDASNRDQRRLDERVGAIAKGGGAPCLCGNGTIKAKRGGWDWNHDDGTECARRFAQPDLEALAVRLLGEANPAAGEAA